MEYFIGLLIVAVLAVNAYYMAKLLRVFKELGKAVKCLLEEYEDIHELVCKIGNSITVSKLRKYDVK